MRFVVLLLSVFFVSQLVWAEVDTIPWSMPGFDGKQPRIESSGTKIENSDYGQSNYASGTVVWNSPRHSGDREKSKAVRLILQGRKAVNFDLLSVLSRSSGATIYERASPSVVKIFTGKSEGSGVLIDDTDGYGLILTNEHVISGSVDVGVIFSEEEKRESVSVGSVVMVDQISDLALVKLNEKRQNLKFLPVRAASTVKIGDDVHAIGHPEGQDWTYTRGYVSQLRKNYQWQSSPAKHHVADVIQTQTPINPGNSGGPLLDDRGELIGLNSFKKNNAEGINFAVDLNSILKFLSSQENRKRKPILANLATILTSVDGNKNGQPEQYWFDFNENSRVDAVGHDKDENGVIEVWQIDRDESGFAELIVMESDMPDISGILYYFDEDEDGIREAVGIDFDRDKKIDQLVPLL